MGTRSDYYIGKGKDAEWLGSLAFDGYPDGNAEPLSGITTEAEYRAKVAEIFAAEKDQATLPDMGWPWPWDDSRTTDYAYTFADGKALVSDGEVWADHKAMIAAYSDEDEAQALWDAGEPAEFPTHGGRAQSVTFGHRSGALFFTAGGQ